MAKTVCLLKFVRDLSRTENNIAAVLADTVDQPAPLVPVQVALKHLIAAPKQNHSGGTDTIPN
ncbi:hypothetical protein DK28_0209825 [Peptococcaceae bacterium SCADC1_2_3]|nr:hypothetical protein DK28_0209825 [Peptococcaceae bacterium SCADC1_2_3]KFI34867.1 hypothetical protein HY00_09015 [Peptococcaceae bacterium SCADC1_2_3]